tara:strand:+ start:2708 stop:3136 length:429 start_codon:yes stop_codon:yes gene_type:complete
VAGDANTVRALARAAYAQYVPDIGREPGPMAEDYAARVAEGAVQVLVEGDKILGFIVLFEDSDALLLDNVAVAPDAQGRGFGRLLVEAAEAEARALGHDRIRLYTHVRMTANIALYTRLGFRETRRVTEKGFHRVYMEKRLG